jgi:hypothetical protein
MSSWILKFIALDRVDGLLIGALGRDQCQLSSEKSWENGGFTCEDDGFRDRCTRIGINWDKGYYARRS